ncbi:MAG: M penetrans family 1 protein [Bergeyella zoohelcum]|nr:M penetrans family 1 protein [Bergeyella zoohelcum]
MKKNILIIAIMAIFALMSFAMADFYSSITKVDYVDGSKTLKFTTKLNVKHIAEALKINPETASFEAEVKKYVNKSFDVSVNGTPKALTFTGSQVNGESVWVYFETGGVESVSSLKIRNTILLDAYPKQFNVVNVAYKGQQKTLNFSRGKETGEVSF